MDSSIWFMGGILDDKSEVENLAVPVATAAQALTTRITEYLCLGGLWNPELMNHAAVRELLIDCRDALGKSAAMSKAK